MIESIYPQLLPSPGESRRTRRHGRRAEAAGGAGAARAESVLAFDAAGLVAVARATGSVIELVPQVGDFVATGDPLFRVLGGKGPLGEELLQQRIALGPERTIEQDPAFSFRIIVDIAAKALSPAINDPTTAVLAIDQLHHLLRNVGTRRLDTGRVRDREGRLRLVYRTPDWGAFVDLALTEIRQFGTGSIQVARRLRALLEDLMAALPPPRHPPLRAELRTLQRSAERAFHDPEDRARAGRLTQGLGGGSATSNRGEVGS